MHCVVVVSFSQLIFFILANHFRVLYELLKVREVCDEKIYICAFMGGLSPLLPSPFFLNYYIQDRFLFQVSIETTLDLIHWKLFQFFIIISKYYILQTMKHFL